MQRYLPDVFYRFGGFLLGAVTVLWTLEQIDQIERWGNAIHLSDALFPPAYWWVTIPLNTFTVGFLNVACLLGPYAFLGGLIGAHKMKTGLIVCTLTIAGMLVVGMVAFGFQSYSSTDWLVWISLPLALLSNLLGVWVPYLLGFSLKRLVLLSVFSPAKK